MGLGLMGGVYGGDLGGGALWEREGPRRGRRAPGGGASEGAGRYGGCGPVGVWGWEGNWGAGGGLAGVQPVGAPSWCCSAPLPLLCSTEGRDAAPQRPVPASPRPAPQDPAGARLSQVRPGPTTATAWPRPRHGCRPPRGHHAAPAHAARGALQPRGEVGRHRPAAAAQPRADGARPRSHVRQRECAASAGQRGRSRAGARPPAPAPPGHRNSLPGAQPGA